MSRNFTSSVAAAAMMALLAGSAFAQTPAAPETNPPRAAAQAPVALPQVLADAGLTDVTRKETRRGERINGKLADGTVINAMLNAQGVLAGLRAEGDALLPASITDALIPQAVRSQPIFAEITGLNAVFMGEQGVMLSGTDAQKNPLRAAFAEDGTLMRFGRGEMGRDRGPDRKHGGRDGGREAHGKHGDHDGMKHPRRGDRAEGHGPRGDDMRREAGEMPLGADEVRASLTEAGYTEIGQILQQGPITIAQVTNPEGERVLVELDPAGQVVRELNR
ncbi:hypothetical protein [Paracoccus ravus]|uniref:hypothetical protein n=1 Tax=Paracoccus ravus TaxID=2447760 RepID=UPI00106EE91C|nr:hypothetical protein [Paracoccus ravus]